jgi:hypothetical protein
MRRIIAAIFFVLFSHVIYDDIPNTFTVKAAFAQTDTRIALANLITDLQAGTVKWRFITPQLAQSILKVTGGTGMDQNLRALGPIQNLSILDQQMLPHGRVSIIRAYFPGTALDWEFVQGYDGLVHGLTYRQAAEDGSADAEPDGPPISTAPLPTEPGGRMDGSFPGSGAGPQPSPPTPPAQPRSGGGARDGCDVYPQLC